MQSGSAANSMRLGDYFKLLGRHWLAVLLCLVLGVGAALVYLKEAPREYQATASVLVSPTGDNSTTTSTVDKTGTINLDTEAQLVVATGTVSEAAKTLKVSAADASSLGDNVSVSVPPNTEILDITYTGTSADGAVKGALAFAQAYLDQRKAAATAVLAGQVKALQQRIDAVNVSLAAVLKAAVGLIDGSSQKARNDSEFAQLNNQLATLTDQQNQVKAETITPGAIVTQPRLPDAPSSPNKMIALAAGVLLGLVLGVAVAALRNRRDDLIRTPEDLFDRTRVPVAAVLSARLHDGEVSVLEPLSADGRGYARLRNLVTSSLEQSSRHVVLVAGVRRGAGPVAANLAASLARAGEEVVLVCADVFGTTATALLADVPGAGLAEVLSGEKSVDAVVPRLASIPNLRVLGPGSDVDRADALLQTGSPRKLVDRLLESATCVIIEAPPTTHSPDAQTLASGAELAVLVVETGATNARDVVDACAQMESMGTPVLGAVMARYGRDSQRERSKGEAAVPEAGAPAEGPATAAATTAETSATSRPGAPKTGTTSGNGATTGNGAGAPEGQLVPPGSRGNAPR
ncbi:MAG: Wzz/FepE/Etk N-terminal domain-containing protein [Blastococcus sp.]